MVEFHSKIGLVSRQNDEWIALYDEAVYQLALGNVDQCIEELNALLKEYPDCLDAQLALGNAYLRKNGICRISFRDLAYRGEIPGKRTASWKAKAKGG